MKPRDFFQDAQNNPSFQQEMDKQLKDIIPPDLRQQMDDDQWKILLGDYIISSVTDLEDDVQEKIMNRAQELISKNDNEKPL